MAAATLSHVVKYLKTDTPIAKGTETPLDMVKELDANDRAELVESLSSLDASELRPIGLA
jgi:hypothetical protein